MPFHAPIATPVLGWLMGALIPIEPDHLCSLIALNAGERRPWQAFIGGMTWGIGHSIGMLTFCVIFLPLQSLIQVGVWEHYGNYVAGILLIGIGSYFLAYETRYLELSDDGSWVPKQDACSCCHAHVQDPHTHSHHKALGHVHGPSCTDDHCSSKAELDEESEGMPLLSGEEKIDKQLMMPWAAVDLRGAIVGMTQGLCCPSCIAGLAFVGQMGAQHPSSLDMLAFFTVCFASLVLCSGFISAGVVAFKRSCENCFSVSTRTVFRVACAFSIALGTAWIVLNASGNLHVIQYTDVLEQQLHGMSGTKHGDVRSMEMMHY